MNSPIAIDNFFLSSIANPVNGATAWGFFDTYKAENPHFSPATFTCAEETVDKLLSTNTPTDRPGMLLGKVQSGKTRTYISIAANAFDRGFGAVVVLTKNSRALSEQTIKRLKSEFGTFVDNGELSVHDIMTAPGEFTAFELESKLIFVAKKQTHNLDRLIALFRINLGEVRTLIIDDEADSASVGYRRRNGDLESTAIATKINELRGLMCQSSLLQVTATPYSLYLQPEDVVVDNVATFRPVRPAFTQLVPVPADYVGGDAYFGDAAQSATPTVESCIHNVVEEIEFDRLRRNDRRSFKEEEALESAAIEGYRRAFVTFVVGGCIQILNGLAEGQSIRKLKYCFLLHTEMARSSHSWQYRVTCQLADLFSQSAALNDQRFNDLVEASYLELAQSIQLNGDRLPSLDDVKALVRDGMLRQFLTITKVNSDEHVAKMLDENGQLKLRSPLNIFIGGQVLDRGVTLENLIGFYYGRRPQRFQQDTVLQHSRMYGFRRQDIAVTRFHTSVGIRQAMFEMEEFDSSLRSAIESGGDAGVQFIRRADDGSIIPCSPNKILIASTHTLRPYRRIIPVGFQTGYKTHISPTIQQIDARVQALIPFNAAQPVEIEVGEAIGFLNLIEPTLQMEPDALPFNWDAAKAALCHLSQQHPVEASRGKVLLWTANNRNSARLAGAVSHTKYIATPDSQKTEGKLTKDFAVNLPILFLLRQNGNAPEWRGTPFYWPVIRAQANTPTAVYTSESQV